MGGEPEGEERSNLAVDAADVAEGLLLSEMSLAISLRCPISGARMRVSSGCYNRMLLSVDITL